MRTLSEFIGLGHLETKPMKGTEPKILDSRMQKEILKDLLISDVISSTLIYTIQFRIIGRTSMKTKKDHRSDFSEKKVSMSTKFHTSFF